MELHEPATKPPIGICTVGTITRVIDGDTLVFSIRDAIPCAVRLLDCWAPESRTSDKHEKQLGTASKEHLKYVEGLRATLYVPTDQAASVGDLLTFGRILGAVWVEGHEHSLSEVQRCGGYAYATKDEMKSAIESSRTSDETYTGELDGEE